MKRTFKLMLVAVVALLGFSNAMAAELVGSTQYGSDGFQYVIKDMTKVGTEWTGTVSVKQNIFAGAAITIASTVDIPVEGTVSGEECKETVTFDVVEIEADGFKNLTGVTSITIGSNIKTIGAGAFAGCEGVTSITFAANENNMEIGENAFKDTKPTTLDLSPITGTLEVKKWWDNSAFVPGTEVNNTLTTVTFPKKVTKIVEDAFAGFTALTTVNFTPATDTEAVLLTIGTGAFQETAIETLTLTDARILELNKLFEDDNVTLKTVNMSKYVKTLNENALANCIQLGTVNFSASTQLKSLKKGSLSNTIVSTYDFSNCCELNTLGTAYTSFLNFEVGENPFVNGVTKTNKNLTTVVLPKKTLDYSPVNEIATVFANCEVLTTITNLDVCQITKVEDGAFANDINLAALTFPNTLATVTGAPFAGCKKLATLTFDGTALTQLGTEATDVVYYTDAEAAEYNATLDGAVSTADVKVPALYYADAAEYNTDKGTTLTDEDFAALSDDEKIKTPAEYYTEAEAIAVNAGLTGAVDNTTVKTPAVAGQDLFGDYKYDGVVFDSPLTTLNINVEATTGSTSVKINEEAFGGNGSDKSALKNVNIAVGGKFAGTIAAKAITLTSKDNSAVAFGEIDGATFNKIQGAIGTNTATLTIDKYTSATTTEPIINGTISAATIKGEVAGANVLVAIGQAQVINFQGEISNPLTASTVPNAVLTTLNFNNTEGVGIVMAAATIPEAAFDETTAPLLTAVNWVPATATKAFNKKAFGASEKGEVYAMVTLTTTPAVAALYDKKEKNLWNVKFAAADVPAEPVEIEVYGNATAEYFYGKYEIKSTDPRLAIAKTNDDGDQVEVYTAFVDSKDQKIYMDRLSLKNGEYVLAAGEPVIIRVKNPTTTATWSKVSGGLVAKVKAYETKKYSTMRYLKTGSSSYGILNDLQITDKVFSSDYIGTTYVGKTLFAMANPGKVGTLQFDPVAKTSYLPKGALFVETEETGAAARLEIVWLNGNESEVTGIINNLKNQETDDVIYNLQGVRVNGTQKGVYIQNGKKIIIK